MYPLQPGDLRNLQIPHGAAEKKGMDAPPDRRDQRKLRALVLVVSAAMLLAAGLLLPTLWRSESVLVAEVALPWWWMILPCALAGAELRFRINRSVVFATFLEFPVVIGLFACTGPGLLGAYAVGTLVSLVVLRYRPVFLVFNVSGCVLDCTVGVLAFRAVLGDETPLSIRGWAAALVATAVFAVFGSARAAIVGIFRGSAPEMQWLRELAVCLGVAAANTTLAVLGIQLLHADVRFVWPIAALAVAVLAAYRNYISLLNHHEGLNRLYDSSRTLEAVAAQDDSVRTMLDQSVELLGGEVAELVVSLQGASGVRRFRAARDQSAWEVVGGSPGPTFEAMEALMREADGDRPATVESDDHRSLVARLHGSGGPIAVLRVETDRGVVFTESDRRLFEMFVNHASVALQNSQLVDQLRDEVAQREHEALHDALTALPNRVMFDLQTRRALADRPDGGLVAVALIDIDHFKEVNDTLGHRHGDELLAVLARRLDRLATDRDLVVSRLGGDEFAVLVTSAPTVEEVASVVDDVKLVIEESVEIAAVRVAITASVGISVFDEASESVDGSTMLRQADVAMYIAKRQHLGVVFYDRADDPYSPKRLSLAADLRHAVERGEIEAFFQPEIDLRTGDVISVEALARWTHPVHGNIVPDQFIPIAEQSGLIRDLTYLMLEQSLERIRQWRSHGFDLHVAVNLSVRCLADDRLVERVMTMLERAGLGPESLTLEVTEGTIMADPEHALAVLGRLNARGIRLSIDDFGMGYSSLAQLKRMPVGQLKVDRSFVTYVSEDHDDAAIVKSVTDLGHNLGLEVIAEGVEDQATLDKLISLGCDSVQGFYLARPMSADQTLRWLRQREQQRADPAFDPKFAIARIG